MENVNTNKAPINNSRKYLVTEIVLIVVSVLFFVFSALTARSAIKVLKKIEGVIGGIVMLPLFIITAFASFILAIASTSLSGIGWAKTKDKKQIATLVISILLIVGCIVEVILTLVVKI